MNESDLIDPQAKQDTVSPADPQETPLEQASDSAPSSTWRPTYIRPLKPRITQEAIDNIDEDTSDAESNYTHDSNYSSNRGIPFADRGYRGSKADMRKVQQNSQYGQYLQIPKGNKSIFASRMQTRQRNSTAVYVVIIAVLFVIILFAISLIVDSG